ncbi:MAG: hypothetical protein J6D20_06545 [Clostridia bacterium]|nr:hypothetical protein [Clostridia bacterium]
MKNTKLSRIILLALSVAVLVGCALAFSVSAAEEKTTNDMIYAQNVVYGDKVAIAYAVNVPVADAANTTVNYYWEDAPDVIKKATYFRNDTIDGVEYPVFITEGVAAKELAKVAYVTTDGGKTHKSYSAAEYLYVRLYEDGFAAKTEADGKDYNRKLLYQNLLNYGEQAQIVFDHNGTRLTEYSFAYTTNKDVKLNGASYVFGAETVTATYSGAGPLESWISIDTEGVETVLASADITVDGVIKVDVNLGAHNCADVDPKDHKCDTCGEVLSECKNENADHLCDICGVVVSTCADANSDGKCDVCGIYTFASDVINSGSAITIRNITSSAKAMTSDTITNSSSISSGAPDTMPYGAHLYLDTPASAANKVLVINTNAATGPAPSGSTKVTDYLSDIVFTPDVAVENGDLIVLEFDYCLQSLTSAPQNGYPLYWYLDYSGETADATMNAIYSYNKGNPRLQADSDKAYSFTKGTWVRIRLVCDNTNKKLYTYISNNGGESYNTCATVSSLASTLENIGFSTNVSSIVAVQYVDNIKCVKTTAEAYGITLN